MKPSIESQRSRGMELLGAGRFVEAESHFQSCCLQYPGIADFYVGLGESLYGSRDLEGAIRAFRSALQRMTHPIFHNRLGIVLCQVGKLREAVNEFEAALKLAPAFIEARSNLGMTLVHLGSIDTGMSAIRQSISLQPDHADSWQTRASALYALGDTPATAIASGRALSLVPSHGPALALRALSARQLGQLAEAATMSRRAAALDPKQAEILETAAILLRDLGRSEEAVTMLRRGLVLDDGNAALRAVLIMCLNYVPAATPGDLLVESQKWAGKHAVRSDGRRTPSPPSGLPLRVGLVSGDFFRHPVGYFLDPVLPKIDRSRIKLVAFSTRSGSDEFTARLRKSMDSWHDISTLDDETAFELIVSESIDILVDLSGYTAGGRLRLFSLRPAPVQVAWMGYFGTTGLPAIDWIIADRQVIPPEAERWYSERVLSMPDSYICYGPPASAPPVAASPSERKGYVTFGCCNTPAKITSGAIALWAEILREVANSRLLLKGSAFETKEARHHFTRAFSAHGIDDERLVYEGWSSYEEFLDVYGRIDVALDPFPFCGGLTTLETLWMGVPMVSLAGDRFAGRQSLSYLTTIGRADLCVKTKENYAALATELAKDGERRRRLRLSLRADMAASPLLDGARFARNLTDVFETIARR